MVEGYRKSVLQIYDDAYAEAYAANWNESVPFKNPGNLQCIDELLVSHGSWLDLCCGTAWHFGQIDKPCEKTGLDLSASQLCMARKNFPAAYYIQGDVLEIEPSPDFDLVTSFWIAYGYLDDFQLIAEFCRRMVAWLKPGGNLVLEILDRDSVQGWNTSNRARQTIERVFKRSEDWRHWTFFDKGGAHNLATPDREFFDELLAPAFARNEFRFDRNWCGLGKL